MHLIGHEALLVTTATLSFAVLAFLFVYLIFLDKGEVECASGKVKDTELIKGYVARPVWLARAIGDDKNAALRPFRAADFLLATLPVAWLTLRRRKNEENAAKASVAVS